jgi:hypothetical protein
LGTVKSILNSALSKLEDAEDAGFLVTVERHDLYYSYDLIEASTNLLKKKLYDEAFAKMRNAYNSSSNRDRYTHWLCWVSTREMGIGPFTTQENREKH